MEQTDNSNHKSIRVKVEVRIGITIREIIRIGTDLITNQIAETKDNTDKTEAGLDMNKILREVTLEEMLEIMVNKTVEESIEKAIEITVMTEAGTGLEKGHFPEIMAKIELEVQTTVDPGQDPELAQIGIGFIVISVGNTIISQGTVLLLLNLGNQQTMTPPTSNMKAELSRVNSEENLRENHLNL